MAVWVVEYQNASESQRFSAIRVAETAEDARLDFIATYDISELASRAGSFAMTQRHDPEGRYEAVLVEAERRRMDDDFYRMPVQRRGRR